MEGERGVIVMSQVAAGYGRTEVLHGVDLTVPEGRVTTLIGSNGSGKSTLLRALLGFIPLWGGDIKVEGISVKGLSRREAPRKIA